MRSETVPGKLGVSMIREEGRLIRQALLTQYINGLVEYSPKTFLRTHTMFHIALETFFALPQKCFKYSLGMIGFQISKNFLEINVLMIKG